MNGIAKMIEDDRHWMDIRPQIQAVCFFLLALFLSLGLPAAGLAHGPEGHGEQPQASELVDAPKAEATEVAAEEAELPEVAPEPPVEVVADEAGVVDVLRALHPASVHFPIAFFLLAGLLEALAMARRGDFFATVDILVVAGTAGAVVAALLGWIHTGLWLGGDPAMQWHRWTGTGVALGGLVMLFHVRRGNRGALRVMLALICLALLAQGYWGGELAHGPNHLTASH